MLPELLCVCFLFMAASTNAANMDMSQYSMVYFNPFTKLSDLKGEVEDANIHPLALSKVAYRGLSCNCNGYTCGCCAGINITSLSLDRRACANIMYIPEELALKVAMTIDDKEIYATNVSARNPPAICAPFPLAPPVNFCVRLFDVYPVEKNLHACIDFETRVMGWTALAMHFNCVTFGTDGVNWSKPGENNNVPEDVKPQTSGLEVYDDVDFAHDPASPINEPAILTPEQENNIGQLKL